ncbi:serine/threonine protein kinase [Pendulispora brunnea]|uniref:Serine/threonine protein kinase n=1 Tax=Pendulispora brunnea TaxID=2905690 RepID=A0ABZ2JVC6_9BACT
MSAVERKTRRREVVVTADAWTRSLGHESTLDDVTPITRVRALRRKRRHAKAEPPILVGDLVASKYRIERVLGYGDMGLVVAARHLQLGFLVAIKFMRPEAQSESRAARFFREARAVARLRGEHTARITDYGSPDGGAPYIVMEHLEGIDLKALVQRRGKLPIEEAVGYLIDACKAMDEAHRVGIVHRDLKPKNLFLTHRPDGTPLVKVLDFGISKLTETAEDEHASSTESGSILGSPGFMSPEQIRDSKQVDARSDIYGLGAVLYYLLANDYPFSAISVSDLLEKILHEPPHSLRDRRPDVPAAIEAIVSRCLQKDPSDRYPNVKELMDALRGALEQKEQPSTVLRDGVVGARLPAVVLMASVAMGALLARCAPYSACMFRDFAVRATSSAP